MSIPPFISYPFAAIQNYIYTFNQVDNSLVTTNTITSNYIQFQSNPHRVYISVSISNNNKTWNMPESFFPITNVNITWGNKTGILSTLTQKDLYLICIKNGLKQSWPKFYGRAINTYVCVHLIGTMVPLLHYALTLERIFLSCLKITLVSKALGTSKYNVHLLILCSRHLLAQKVISLL
jgi:hypothetical protein